MISDRKKKLGIALRSWIILSLPRLFHLFKAVVRIDLHVNEALITTISHGIHR